MRKLVTSISSDKHTIHITESDKVALSAFDDRHYYLSDGVRSYAYGHYKIVQKQNKHQERTLKSYIEMNEREIIGDLAEQRDSEIEETYSSPDPRVMESLKK